MGQIQSKGSYAADAEANTASLTWNSHLSHSKKKTHLPHSEQGHITRYWQIGYIGPVTLPLLLRLSVVPYCWWPFQVMVLLFTSSISWQQPHHCYPWQQSVSWFSLSKPFAVWWWHAFIPKGINNGLQLVKVLDDLPQSLPSTRILHCWVLQMPPQKSTQKFKNKKQPGSKKDKSSENQNHNEISYPSELLLF